MVYINILSLDRSRSTVVNVYLAKIINGIALGEVSSTINPKFGEKKSLSKAICACGCGLSKCNFWVNILNNKSSKSEFLKLTSKGNFVESSKTIIHSKWLRRNCSNELVGVFLLRSFNEWSKSVLRVINKKQEGSFKDIFIQKGFRKASLRLFLRRLWIFRLLEFYSTNIRLFYEIRNYKKKYIIFTSKDLGRLSKFKNEIGIYSNHIIRGNRAGSTFSGLQYWDSRICIHIKILELIFNYISVKDINK